MQERYVWLRYRDKYVFDTPVPDAVAEARIVYGLENLGHEFDDYDMLDPTTGRLLSMVITWTVPA